VTVSFSIPYVDEARTSAVREAMQTARANLVGERDSSVPEPVVERDPSFPDDLTGRLSTVGTALTNASPSHRNVSERHLDALASAPASALGFASAGAPQGRYVSRHQLSAERGSIAIVPRIDPVAHSELTAWRYGVTAGYRPFHTDPPQYEDPLFYEASDRTGTDIRDFYLFSSSGGIHFIMTFRDGDPMTTNAGYYVSLVSGEIELWWRLEGGARMTSRTTVLSRTTGDDRELRTYSAPHATDDFAVIGTIPVEAVEYAHSQPGLTGAWELEVTVEERIENRPVTRDSIPWGDNLYF
jgi:hypothetical protein